MLTDERLCDSAMPPPRPTRQQLNPLLRETVPRLSIHWAHLRPLSTTWPLTSLRESDNGRRGGRFTIAGGLYASFFCCCCCRCFFSSTPLCPFDGEEPAGEQLRKCFKWLSPANLCSLAPCSNYALVSQLLLFQPHYCFVSARRAVCVDLHGMNISF